MYKAYGFKKGLSKLNIIGFINITNHLQKSWKTVQSRILVVCGGAYYIWSRGGKVKSSIFGR